MRKVMIWIGAAATVLCAVLLITNPKIYINREHFKVVVITKESYHSYTMTYSDGFQWDAKQKMLVPVSFDASGMRPGYHRPVFSTLNFKFSQMTNGVLVK